MLVPNIGTESFKSSQRGPAPVLTHPTSLSNGTPAHLLEPWEHQLLEDRSTGRIDALGGNSSGLGANRGPVGTLAAAILAADGARPGAESLRWLVRMRAAARGVPCTLRGEPCCRYRPCRPTSAPAGSGRACARSPDGSRGRWLHGFPGTRGPRPGDGEGHADTAWPEAPPGERGLALACCVLLFRRDSLPKGRICVRPLH